MGRLRAIVKGRVQGVSYRMSAAREATRRGLVGWVANLGDGSVVVEAQGAAPALELFLEWCRHGPPGAHVTAVDLKWLNETAGEERFEIRH
jgi:acylphosphatase